MLEADTLAAQASTTARDWMINAQEFVDEWFAKYPLEARVTLIAAYVNAAAKDEIAMYVRGLAEAHGLVANSIERLEEAMRSDHPLQGETFGGLRDALYAIAGSLDGVAEAAEKACPLCCTCKKP